MIIDEVHISGSTQSLEGQNLSQHINYSKNRYCTPTPNNVCYTKSILRGVRIHGNNSQCRNLKRGNKSRFLVRFFNLRSQNLGYLFANIATYYIRQILISFYSENLCSIFFFLNRILGLDITISDPFFFMYLNTIKLRLC